MDLDKIDAKNKKNKHSSNLLKNNRFFRSHFFWLTFTSQQG